MDNHNDQYLLIKLESAYLFPYPVQLYKCLNVSEFICKINLSALSGLTMFSSILH